MKADTRKWVVYLQEIGTVRPGIYYRNVSVDGKLAFVHPSPRSKARRADVVPSMNVFDTKDAAHQFYVGDGADRWVVYSKSHNSVPEVFQAKVKSYCGEHGHTRYTVTRKGRAAVRTFQADFYGRDAVFDTERQAVDHLSRELPRLLKDAEKSFSEASATRAGLRELARRLAAGRGKRKAGRR